MSESRKILLVAACALVDTDGRILLRSARRARAWQDSGSFRWQVEAGETPEETLVRELSEELGIVTKVPCLAPLTFASHTYETFHL